MKITDAALSRIDLGNRPERIFKDEKLTGFAARARRNAKGEVTVSFFVVWQERQDGKRLTRKHAIGTWRDPWTATDARDQAEKMLRARDSGKRVENGWKAAKKDLTLNGLLDGFEKDHLPTVSAKTATEYKTLAARRIRPKLGALRARDIKRSDVQEWHAALSSTPYEANRALAVLSRAMRYGIEEGKLEVNACIGVRRFKERAREEWLDEEMLPKFAKVLFSKSSPHHQLLKFLLFSGWRVSEAIALRWDALDGLHQTATIETKTGSQKRHLSSAATEILEVAEHRHGFIFSSREGRQGLGYKQVRETMLAVCVEAGVKPLTPHALRRGAATMAAIHGASVMELREAFGWKTDAMASRYVKSASSLGRTGSNKVADAISILTRVDSD